MMCILHYTSYSCDDEIPYKITYCKKHTDSLKGIRGLGCMTRERVCDKVDNNICDICAFQDALKKDPDTKPPPRTPLETAYEKDA
jgi:hypothetical protein